MRRLNKVALTIAISISAIAAIAVAASVVGQRLGFQASVMQTGSMAPNINPGDLVVVKRSAPAAIRVGDIISFEKPLGTNAMVTHRVAGVKVSAGAPEFSTKGDRNPLADPWRIRYQQAAWKVVAVVPIAGKITVLEHLPIGHALVLVATFLIALALLLPAATKLQSKEAAA